MLIAHGRMAAHAGGLAFDHAMQVRRARKAARVAGDALGQLGTSLQVVDFERIGIGVGVGFGVGVTSVELHLRGVAGVEGWGVVAVEVLGGGKQRDGGEEKGECCETHCGGEGWAWGSGC